MSEERWNRVKGLFEEALTRPSGERPAFLAKSCPGDPETLAEIESLLAAHEQAGGFLARPALIESGTAADARAALAPGKQLGPYQILAAIGSGAVGDVYRARDSRLDRDVAIKVLPRELAADAGRRERFEREARAASALDHPNVVAVHDAGWHEGTPFMVTELLEGQTLAERLAQGPITVRKSLEYLVQAARGMAAAHARGIVHRDLKPSNLFLTSQGQLKILDFGVAKLARGSDAVAGDERGGTTPGLAVGTVDYMSPEQVRGARVDARSDQFGLGCVLYELLAGEPPFRRSTAAETMAAVLQDEPVPVERANPRVPRPVAWIVERCLAKDPGDRYGATQDLARDLELALGRFSEFSTMRALAGRAPRFARRALVLAIVIGAGAVGFWLARRQVQTVPVVRYLTYSGDDASPAAAPDGATVAFSSNRDGRRRIWLKQLTSGSEAPLTDGDDDHPRFSPDGASLLFTRYEGRGASLYRVPAVGGAPHKVVDDALYGDFAPDGRRIAFVRRVAAPPHTETVIGTVGLDGSGLRELARLKSELFVDTAFVHPRWSPDGREIAATQSTHLLGEPNVIALLDVASGVVRTLPPVDGSIWRGGLAWAAPGQILCSKPETVASAQTGTNSRLALLDVATNRARPLFSAPVTISRVDVVGAGRLVLESSSVRHSLREIRLKPGAGAKDRWLTHGNSSDRQPIFEPGGEWVAFSSNRSGNLDIWAVSRRSGEVRRLTDDPGQDSDPAFTAEGRLLWSSNRSGSFEIWLAEADGSGARQISRDGADADNPVVSRDGQWIVYASANPQLRGLMKMRQDGTEATLLVPGDNLILPEISPDGSYVAYVAEAGNDSATLRVASMGDGSHVPFEIMVPRRTRGSAIDHGRCRWLPDGHALAYISRDSSGPYGVYVQEFVPGVDSRARRRRVTGLEPELDAESLAVSPDGSLLAVAFQEERFDLMLLENLAGLPARFR